MSMDYEIFTAREIKTVMNSACWASFPRTMRDLSTSARYKYKNGDIFRTRLILDDRSSYRKHTTTDHRNLSDEVFDKLFGPWMHPDWWYGEYRTPNRKARSSVVYTSACPYWVMVASGSVYRMHYDFSSFLYHWEQIDKVQKEVGYKLRPWTQYFMCVSINNSGNSAADFRTSPVNLGVTNGHMMIDGKNASIEAIQHLSGWTPDVLKNGDGVHQSCDSMYKQWNTPHALSTSGRDAFFTGFAYKEDKEAVVNFIHREAEIAGIDVRSKTNPYCTATTVHLPEFIEKVCIPNQL